MRQLLLRGSFVERWIAGSNAATRQKRCPMFGRNLLVRI
jgi:hypothetical protein